MPYFVYKITTAADTGGKQLEKLDEFPSFPAAKKRVKSLRIDLQDTSGVDVRIMFAETSTEAEARLTEQRTKPVLEEWEA